MSDNVPSKPQIPRSRSHSTRANSDSSSTSQTVNASKEKKKNKTTPRSPKLGPRYKKTVDAVDNVANQAPSVKCSTKANSDSSSNSQTVHASSEIQTNKATSRRHRLGPRFNKTVDAVDNVANQETSAKCSTRANSDSSSNAQTVHASSEIQKNKTTSRRHRLGVLGPRFNKAIDTVDNVANQATNVQPFLNHKNEVAMQMSIPSTSKNYVNHTHDRKSLNHQVEIKYEFVIQPVTSPNTGQLIRKRNSNYKYINLKSYVNKLPCVFTTSKLQSIVNLTSNLSISDRKANMTKSQLRKYPENLQCEPSTSKTTRRAKRAKKTKEVPNTFADYIDADDVSKGLLDGSLIKGFVRINPKNPKDSYVSNDDTSLADYYLTSVIDRNRALEGDEVILKIKPEKEWIDGKKTATVVFISQQIHPRITVGSLKPLLKRCQEFAALHPRDKRMPIIRIPAINWPNGFKTNPKQYEKILFVVKIGEWTVPSHALGMLIENLGLSGDLKVESLSILREFCLDVTPFKPDVIDFLPELEKIPLKEFEYREDIRRECVFTIDPATARDLDDAVSVKELPNGNYEIGVHISDVTFYLEEGTELDQLVSKKATSIYLVDTVYHMLPVELCLHCSLLPGKDKLSFSVFWEMTEDGDIINKRFSRTIMNSCAQLAYEHAQMVIENPDKALTASDFPPIHNGFTVDQLKNTILVLQKIAVKLRERRVQNGALKIDQVKLLFTLDPKSSEPLNYCIYENKASHRLIEEFMLLANISIAERIHEAFPDIAFLRCHEPPKQTMLVELQNSLATCGIHIDISSSGGINASLKKYITDDFLGQCRAAVLNHIIAKAMTRARYFCASTIESEFDYKHYALSSPMYTHFTSPIRRYADIMVHRLLAASLGYCEQPAWDVDYVSAIAANCNAQKYNAKRAGESSADLYLAHFVERNQPFEQDCVVVDVKEKSFDAIVLKTGSIVRVYQNSCEEGTVWKTESIATAKVPRSEETKTENGRKNCEYEKKILRLTITFPKKRNLPQSVLIVETFTTVKVHLERKKNSYKLEATLLRPVCTQTYTRSQLISV